VEAEGQSSRAGAERSMVGAEAAGWEGHRNSSKRLFADPVGGVATRR
jgi:hypothetical protein